MRRTLVEHLGRSGPPTVQRKHNRGTGYVDLEKSVRESIMDQASHFDGFGVGRQLILE